jgi:transposase
MLRAMAAGEDDPEVLADLAKGKLRDKIPFLREALRGQIGPHQRFMLSSHWRVLDAITAEIEELDREVATRMGPDEEAIERLDSIPGVGRWRRDGAGSEPLVRLPIRFWCLSTTYYETT